MIDTPTQIPSPHLRAAAASPPLRAKGWTYEFVEQKDAGTRTGDLIFILYRKPNWILRACGAGDERVSYYRSHGEWYNIGGSRVGNQVGSMLQHLGSKYL